MPDDEFPIDSLKENLRHLEQLKKAISVTSTEHVGWIAENLKTAMEYTERDMNYLAVVTGFSPSTINDFVRRRKTAPQISTVISICLALELSLEDVDRPPAEFQYSVKKGRPERKG